MAATKVLGYNIILTIDSKKIAGTTADTFTLAGKTEETIMKSDSGVTRYDNIGHEGTFSVNAYVMKGTEEGWMNVSDLMDHCADNDQLDFSFNPGSTTGYFNVTGKAMFRNFTVNSDSENYADMTIELSTVGAVYVGHS